MIPRRAFCCLMLAALVPARAEILTVAAASNLAPVIDDIRERYTGSTGNEMRISTAATGALYAQIVNGAPFDVLLAADAERPLKLEQSGHGVAGTRFTYALGRLVLWSRDPEFRETGCEHALAQSGRGRIAIANPVTAPYGRAAREYLQSTGAWAALRPRLVFGENIAQTLQFVATGNAALGLIAEAQALDARLPPATCFRRIPGTLHGPIEQQAILLQRAAGSADAIAFLAFLRGSAAREIFSRSGYSLPP